jgi:hypothetical protein
VKTVCERCGAEYELVGAEDPRNTPWHTHTSDKCIVALKARAEKAEEERDVALTKLYDMRNRNNGNGARADLAERRLVIAMKVMGTMQDAACFVEDYKAFALEVNKVCGETLAKIEGDK